MSNWIDPWISKDALKWYLKKHIERNELDALLQDYVTEILKKEIILRPSIGCKEDGKDIVFCENRKTKSYCTYVIKKGDLQKNLDGKNGIINELYEALVISLPSQQYLNTSRTAIVIHNGYEGSRDAYEKYEQQKQIFEEMLLDKNLLLKPVERWNLDVLTDRLFPHGARFKNMERYRVMMEKQHKFHKISRKHLLEIKEYIMSGESDPQKSESLIKNFYEQNNLDDANYSLNINKTFKEI